MRARIRPYHARLRFEIERYGGTVEKFVGDAVMAVFGAPFAHEDDAERAVRAGLAILDAIAELNEADPVSTCGCGSASTPAKELLLADSPPERARALLVELGLVPGVRDDGYYIALLPELVRTVLALEEPELAARLVAGVESRTRLAEHGLCACRASLGESAGEYAEAAASYTAAAERWREFGNEPERAYALLGQGRCLRALGDAGADGPLVEARALFSSMHFAPAVTEVDRLLGSPEAAAL